MVAACSDDETKIGPTGSNNKEKDVSCLEDNDCDTGKCYFRGVLGAAGECLQTPDAGSCFEDRDCQTGETCDGPTYCPAGEPCFLGTEAGSCVPAQ